MERITDEEARINIAANLRRILRERGMTQTDLVERSGENKMYISRVCNGRFLPNAAALARIAEALDTTCELLMRPVPEKITT